MRLSFVSLCCLALEAAHIVVNALPLFDGDVCAQHQAECTPPAAECAAARGRLECVDTHLECADTLHGCVGAATGKARQCQWYDGAGVCYSEGAVAGGVRCVSATELEQLAQSGMQPPTVAMACKGYPSVCTLH